MIDEMFEFESNDDTSPSESLGDFDQMEGLPELVDVDSNSEFDKVDNLSEEFDIEDIYCDSDELDEHTMDSSEAISGFPSSSVDDYDLLDIPRITPLKDTAYSSLSAGNLAGSIETRNTNIDLYDSGATRHMSGFRHRFINFIEIKPVPIMATDKQTFEAIGKRDKYIYLSNPTQTSSRILLKEVLYSPSMRITLVSISCITKAGSTVVFTGNVCRIYNQEKRTVGEIKVKGGFTKHIQQTPMIKHVSPK